MSWKWYSARTIYRTRVLGSPKGADALYDETATLCEIRVVLLRARSFDEAIAKAEREALDYVSYEHPDNRYGQKVVETYLGECDVFELFDPPGEGVEVYSRTEVVDAAVPDEELVECRMGPYEEQADLMRRNKFLAAEFSYRVPPRT